jgi:hypothetical protein
VKKILRSTALVAGSVAALLVPAGTASAASAAEFNGVATIGCFGCGSYGPTGNKAYFCANGTIDENGVRGGVYVDPNGNAPCNGAVGGDGVTGHGSATFTVNEPVGGATCVLSGTAEGDITVTGAGSTHFNWTRTGAVAVVSTGDWGTAGVAFVVTAPLGNPCTFAVKALFAGALVGA